MFLTQQHHAHLPDDGEEDDLLFGGHAVGYGDDGLQEQLLNKLSKANNGGAPPPSAASGPRGKGTGTNTAQHAQQQQQQVVGSQQQRPRQLSMPSSPYLAHFEQQQGTSLSPSRAAASHGVHELLDDLLMTQAQQQQHPEQHLPPPHAGGSNPVTSLQLGDLDPPNPAQQVCRCVHQRECDTLYRNSACVLLLASTLPTACACLCHAGTSQWHSGS